ncbi:hypothetical protein ROLI_026960 [Roseobacter fucihabitans]|uniref:Uncharacterized protein n=1 Tax=Roseobacter fucihabitans TaxID=1537242 RepID=A0ABZ2BW86_9RHOB|nr:DUF2589 domain-containing protein [Roseobacter litoralis]MBC6967184.1 hypothetical protein [Roseobacter litoralis]
MASSVDLGDLVDAIANGVLEAQDHVKRHQIALLHNYFDKNHRPITLKIRVPSMRDDLDEDEMGVPLLSLVGTTRLAIKDLEVSSTLALGDLSSVPIESADGDEKADAAGYPKDDVDANSPKKQISACGLTKRSALNVDMNATKKNPVKSSAELKLTVEAQVKWSGKIGQRAKMYPTTTTGYTNDEETQFFRQVQSYGGA